MSASHFGDVFSARAGQLIILRVVAAVKSLIEVHHSAVIGQRHLTDWFELFRMEEQPGKMRKKTHSTRAFCFLIKSFNLTTNFEYSGKAP